MLGWPSERMDVGVRMYVCVCLMVCVLIMPIQVVIDVATGAGICYSYTTGHPYRHGQSVKYRERQRKRLDL